MPRGGPRRPPPGRWVPSAASGRAAGRAGAAGTEWIAAPAPVKKVGDRVYILYKDRTNTYLIDAKLRGKSRLVGRYLNQGDENDSTPWVGRIVDNERIDGEWTM